VYADELGFDFWGTSEQHFVPSSWTVSAPETVYGAVAALTKRIKLRTMCVVMLGKINHPLRVAERLSTLSILSQGRLEFGSARSNNSIYQTAFDIDPAHTREEWREGLELVLRAMQEAPVSFEGEIYKVPEPVHVSPRPYSSEPLSVSTASSSLESHKLLGELGIGVMTLENWYGWEFAQQCVDAHIEGFKTAKPIGGLYEANPTRSFLTFPAHVAETRERAISEARETIQGLVAHVIELLTDLAKFEESKGGSTYAYLNEIETLSRFIEDIPGLIEHTPTVMVGTPDDVIERIQRLEKMGYNEIILKIDNYGHATNMRSMEMFAKHVIPAIKNPSLIPANDYERHGITAESYLI